MSGPVVIIPADLHLDEVDEGRAADLIVGVLARAAEFAPCITDAAFTKTAAAKDILVDVVLRRYHAGAGAFSQEGAGPFVRSVDTRTRLGVRFQPEEVAELQALCKQSTHEAIAGPLYLFPPAGWPV